MTLFIGLKAERGGREDSEEGSMQTMRGFSPPAKGGGGVTGDLEHSGKYGNSSFSSPFTQISSLALRVLLLPSQGPDFDVRGL